MNRPNILACAAYYSRLGWSFYPTKPRSKDPHFDLLPMVDKIDKHRRPYRGPGWSPYQNRLPSAEEIRAWFTVAPTANLAICTGAVSGLVIIDLDEAAAIADLCEFCGIESLTELGTLMVQSRRGYHLYFRHPGFSVSGTLGIKGVDIKGDLMCCTAPPSIHASGWLYRFTTSPRDTPLQPLPDAVLERLQENARPKPVPALVAPRFDAGATAYARSALRNAVTELLGTKGNRNDTLNGIAYGIGRIVATGALDWATAYGALENAAYQIGLTQREVGPTLLSGLGDGQQVPRAIPDRNTQQRHVHTRPAKLDQMRRGHFA